MNSLNHDFAILSNWFYKDFMVLILEKCSLSYFVLKMNLKQISYLTASLLEIGKKKKYFSTRLTSITKKGEHEPQCPHQSTKARERDPLNFMFYKVSFNYCCLIWMFGSEDALHRLNNIHEKSLRLDHVSNFITLFVNANQKSIHKKFLKILMIKRNRYLNDLSPQIMNEAQKKPLGSKK